MIDVDSGYQLVVIKGEDRGRSIDLNHREIHLGRKSSGTPSPNWIYFAEPTVSRHHATLVWDDVRRHFTLYHKSRTNPTLVNGKRILHCPLAHEDVVQIGLLVFRIDYVGTTEAGPGPVVPPPHPRRQPELEDSEDASSIRSGLRLVVTDGPDRGSVYSMTSSVLFIGRRDGLDDLRGANGILLNDDGLPKEQVLLAWNEREQTYGIFQVESSTLPTRILRYEDGEHQSLLLGPNMQMLLQPNDVIRMGETGIRYELESVPLEDFDEPVGDIHDTQISGPPPRVRPPVEDEGVFDEEDEPEAPPARPAEGRPAWNAGEPPRRPTWPPRSEEPEAESGWEPPRRPQRRREPVVEATSATPAPEAPSRRRRELRRSEWEGEARHEAPTLPRPASMFGGSEPGLEEDQGADEMRPARFPRPAPPPPPPVEEEEEPDEPLEPSEGDRIVEDAPLLPSAMEPVRFPSLDVNFVRNLPTRGAEERPSAPARPRVDDAETVTRLNRARPEPVAPPEPDDDAAGRPGLPRNYQPPDLLGDEDDVDGLDFRDSTFAWRYRADYILGFLEGRNRGQKIELLTRELQEGRQITLGSRGERVNDIEVDDAAIPNEQATITYSGGRFSLLNEGEDGSIFLNQIAVGHGEEMLLKTGDRIGMGESVMIFLERSVVQVLSKFELLVTTGIAEDRGRSFDLLREVVVVGRNKSCDVALADPEVSRKHLAITLRNGRFYLTHMSTSNPTFINGISLPRGRDRILNEGDKIQVSDHTTVLFRARPSSG